MKQGEKDTDGYCGSTAAGTGLEQFVATTSRESNAFLSTEVKGKPSWNLGESVHQTVSEDINSLLETSGCVADKALDVEVNHCLEGTNTIFEVNIEQSRPPTDNGECLMDCLGSAPSRIFEQVPNNNSDHMNCDDKDADLVTTDNGECLRHGSAPNGIPEQVPNNNPDRMHCANEVTDLVTTCSTNVLGSAAQNSDAGEEGINCCEGSQLFPDTDVTNELHDAKRRKLIPLEEGRLPENLAGDLHL